MTNAEIAQIAKELTIAFAGKLQVRNLSGQEDKVNETLTNAVTKFYETMYQTVEKLTDPVK